VASFTKRCAEVGWQLDRERGARASREGAGWAELEEEVVLFIIFVLIVVVLGVLGLFVAEDGCEQELACDLGFGVFIGGDREAVVGENGFADDDGGSGLVVEAAGVGAGDLETVEETRGALGVDAVLSHGRDEHGEGELDGFAIL